MLLNGETSALECGVVLIGGEIDGVIKRVLDGLKPEAEVGGDMLVEEIGVEEDQTVRKEVVLVLVFVDGLERDVECTEEAFGVFGQAGEHDDGVYGFSKAIVAEVVDLFDHADEMVVEKTVEEVGFVSVLDFNDDAALFVLGE